MNPAREDDRPTRRLSAVMFTDMVGYSELVGRDEALGLELLAEHRRIVREILARHNGREVDTAGDAFFVEFGSALDATVCAIDIQSVLRERNESQPNERRIVLRIGLHLGDVVHVGDQVQGDGVNIAARMEPLARPGSICLSEDVARQVHNKIDLPIAPIGKRRLKNIRLPMEAYRVVMPWEDDADVRSGGRSASLTPEVRKSLARPMVLAVSAALAIALLWFTLGRYSGQAPEPGDAVSESLVAVLPFTVQGSPEFAYLGKGMVDLLSTKLDGAGMIRAVDPRAIMGLVAQSEDQGLSPDGAGRIARRLGAGRFVLGNIVEVGGNLRIDAAVYSTSQEGPANQSTVEGTAGEIFDLLDDLAAQLVVVDRGGPGAPSERLDALTTTSFEALKHYLQGVNAFRSARFQSAADELSLAVAKDTTFALAWYQLSATAEWLFDPVLALRSVRQALKYSDRLSNRGRRLVQALESAKSGRNDEALRLYREFLTTYPDDVEAWYQLGELIFHSGPTIGVPPEESLEAWDRLLFFEPDQVTAMIHVARVAQLVGDWAQVDSLSSRIIGLEPNAERNAELRAHVAFNRQDGTAVRAMLADLHNAGDDMLAEVLWSVAVFRHDVESALLVAPVMTDESRLAEVRAMGYTMKAYLLAAAGKMTDAQTALEHAEALGNRDIAAHRAYIATLPFRQVEPGDLRELSLDLDRWDAGSALNSLKTSAWYSTHNEIQPKLRDYMRGIVNASSGRSADALRLAQNLESEPAPERTGSLVADLANGIRAQAAINRGDLPEAERLLERVKHHSSYQYAVSSPFFSLARERYFLGEMAARRGASDEAVRAMSYFRGHSIYDLVFVAPSHLVRAGVYERDGENAGAIEHLLRFTELYRDCDAELRPMVEDARRRLAALGHP